jgi:hypothetical protein
MPADSPPGGLDRDHGGVGGDDPDRAQPPPAEPLVRRAPRAAMAASGRRPASMSSMSLRADWGRSPEICSVVPSEAATSSLDEDLQARAVDEAER